MLWVSSASLPRKGITRSNLNTCWMLGLNEYDFWFELEEEDIDD